MAWPAAVAGVIGAAAPIAGDIAAAAVARQNQIDLNNANTNMQYDFAHNGIQWKVEDARKAGINPLYALGASTPSPSPISVGDSGEVNALANLGQDVSRAVDATRSPVDQVAARLQSLQLRGAELDNQGRELQNKLLASQIAKLNSPGANPGIPIPDSVTYRAADGSTYMGPSPEAAQSVHGDLFGPTMWSLRNRLIGPLMDPLQPALDMIYDRLYNRPFKTSTVKGGEW